MQSPLWKVDQRYLSIVTGPIRHYSRCHITSPLQHQVRSDLTYKQLARLADLVRSFGQQSTNAKSKQFLQVHALTYFAEHDCSYATIHKKAEDTGRFRDTGNPALCDVCWIHPRGIPDKPLLKLRLGKDLYFELLKVTLFPHGEPSSSTTSTWSMPKIAFMCCA